jgi:hypothetical protein
VEKTFSAKLKQFFGKSTVLKVLSSEMDPAKIRLKILCDTSFNKDISNEPNFSLIHLAGQYLLNLFLND